MERFFADVQECATRILKERTIQCARNVAASETGIEDHELLMQHSEEATSLGAGNTLDGAKQYRAFITELETAVNLAESIPAFSCTPVHLNKIKDLVNAHLKFTLAEIRLEKPASVPQEIEMTSFDTAGETAELPVAHGAGPTTAERAGAGAANLSAEASKYISLAKKVQEANPSRQADIAAATLSLGGPPYIIPADLCHDVNNAPDPVAMLLNMTAAQRAQHLKECDWW